MNRTERLAVELALRYERDQGREPVYVGNGWPLDVTRQVWAWAQSRHTNVTSLTCDIVSRDQTGEITRLIEVKGKGRRRSSVPIVDRQRDAMLALGSDWWLYVVLDCDTKPLLFVVREPSRLPWKLITPPAKHAGQFRSVEDEGRWHTMPSDVVKASALVPDSS